MIQEKESRILRIDVKELSVTLGKAKLLEQVSFTAYEGECIGIIGANGSGKTTLLKALRGLIKSEGMIQIDGKDLGNYDEKELARHVAYMQQSIEIPYEYTAEDIVMTARYPYQSFWARESHEDRVIVKAMLAKMKVSHLAKKPVNVLSGGERQRVLLAKALAQQTDVLLLDEPTSALDLVHGEELFYELRTLSQQGKTIISVVHDLELAAKYCNRLLLIGDHRVLADGSVDEVLTSEYLQAAFHMDAEVYRDQHGLYRLYIKVDPHDTMSV